MAEREVDAGEIPYNAEAEKAENGSGNREAGRGEGSMEGKGA